MKVKSYNKFLESLEEEYSIYDWYNDLRLGARMQEIADEAGINKAMLHYYFRSKQLLFEAVFKKAFMQLAPQINQVLNSEDSLFEKIENFADKYVSFIMENRFLPNFIIQELNNNPEFAAEFFSRGEFPKPTNFLLQIEEEIQKETIKSIIELAI